jgi:Tol biopolymer transport system component
MITKLGIRLLTIGLAIALVGCSLQLDSDLLTDTPLPPTPLPASPTVVEATLPVEAASATPSGTSTPATWAGLGAKGRLVYTQNDGGIIYLDLETGTKTTLYAPPPNAWVRAASVSPDGKLIVMAYAPPPTSGVQLGFTDLFVLSTDGTIPPTPILRHSSPSELYVTPVWSPDGKYVYYGHFILETNNGASVVKYSLNRIAYPGGQPELIASDAFWPQFSPDGTHIAYISYDAVKDVSILSVAKLDGSDVKEIVPAGKFVAVDAPLFYPDGKSLLFSAVGDQISSSLTWIDWLLGVQIASAHDVPSDFWRVSLEDGKLERVTNLQAVGMYADFSPDGQHLAFITTTTIFIARADGSDLKTLSNTTISGTLEWLP